MPSSSHFLAIAAIGWAVAAGVGCRIFDLADPVAQTEKVLRPATSSKSSIAMETRLVLVPPSRLELLEELWLSADEQILDSEVRRELARNGIRAGVVGPAPPSGFAELLQLRESPADENGGWQSLSLEQAPTVTGHRRQMRPHKRLEIQSSGVYDELDLFTPKDAGVTIQTFRHAQGYYAMKWTPLPQDRIAVELTPELHHGTPSTQWAAGEGNDLRMQVAKDRQVFENLQMRVPMSAGQMLVVSCDPEAGGSLGYYFHTLPSKQGNQHKLVIIRLAQVPDPP